jgi:hypothetical protein
MIGCGPTFESLTFNMWRIANDRVYGKRLTVFPGAKLGLAGVLCVPTRDSTTSLRWFNRNSYEYLFSRR